jgi:hypothetical protein
VPKASPPPDHHGHGRPVSIRRVCDNQRRFFSAFKKKASAEFKRIHVVRADSLILSSPLFCRGLNDDPGGSEADIVAAVFYPEISLLTQRSPQEFFTSQALLLSSHPTIVMA